MKVLYDKNKNRESGVMIKEGVMTPYTKVDLTDFLDDVKAYREVYNNNAPKNMHHLASIPVDVIENVRITKGYPCDRHGHDLALQECIRMVKSGEMGAFKIHEY